MRDVLAKMGSALCRCVEPVQLKTAFGSEHCVHIVGAVLASPPSHQLPRLLQSIGVQRMHAGSMRRVLLAIDDL